jgi:sulfite reductase (NADPH) flavoprotein alpha-component
MADPDPDAPASAFTKDNPFPARLTEARLLNGLGALKETRHFVVSLAGSGLRYQAGDSLGVFPTNRPADVAEIIQRLGARGNEPVRLPRLAGTVSLREALTSRLALAAPTRRFVEALAARVGDPGQKARLAALLAPESASELEEFLGEREFVDLLTEFPSARWSAQDFVEHLRRLMPRLYSIASSGRVYPEEVHLTVAVVRYNTNGRERVGVCSTFLADRVAIGATPVPVFVAHAHFAPPSDSAQDAIMVGPGTGVAPFRAFVQDRAATGATGRNWLFFGEQHRATDFLYESEWIEHLRTGRLTRLDLAFSRDQPAKIYVQHRMREHGAELWRWLQGGANFYVCGDARHMARDVDATLQAIAVEHGGLTPEQAADYVKALRKAGRYLRDVY